ncbi:CBS domain-containing protein CBSX5 [Rhynchospora pubera]|uniref:CBS domain-containing protein CBSX5 n=1 Tax=Rhynchospora pubera TaxID=906938 RepID=A0AAV8E4H2_9POAL|nr:CBS domain-containing protein CBSX5 [Rhynchospora pubera]
MAVSLLSHEVSDLCIGKPPVRSLPITASVGEALAALKRCPENELCIVRSEKKAVVGKVRVADVICYLCSSEDNLFDPVGALNKPLSDLLIFKETGGAGTGRAIVRQIEPRASLFKAIDEILDGAGTLVVPIHSRTSWRKNHSTTAEFCWLTHEDLIRYLLGSISLFSHVTTLSISLLSLIRPITLSISQHEPAISAIPLLQQAISNGTSVAVLSDNGCLLGEISPPQLLSCDESVAAAIAALSAGEFLSYLEYQYHGFLPESFSNAIKSRLKEDGLSGLMNLMEEVSSGSLLSSGSSSDEESVQQKGHLGRTMSRGYGRRSPVEVVACSPESSLVAVIVQAIAHQVGYVWVVDGGEEFGGQDEEKLVGIVTFSDILKVFREQL